MSASDSGTAFIEDFDRAEFGKATAPFAAGLFITGALAVFILWRIHFKLRLLPSLLVARPLPLLSCLKKPAMASKWLFWFVVAVLIVVVLPFGFALAWGVSIYERVSHVMGAAFILVGLGILLIVLGLLIWWFNKWRLSRPVFWMLVSSVLLFFSFLMWTAFAQEPYTYLGISAVFIGLNMVPTLWFVYLQAMSHTKKLHQYRGRLQTTWVRGDPLPTKADEIPLEHGIATDSQGNAVVNVNDLKLDMSDGDAKAAAVAEQVRRHSTAAEIEAVDKATGLLGASEGCVSRLLDLPHTFRVRILLFIISYIILAVYCIVVYKEAEEGKYVGFITVGAIAVMDLVIYMSVFAGIITEPRRIAIYMTLCRIFIPVFGDRYWMLGHAFMYLFLCVFFGTSIIDHVFPDVYKKTSSTFEVEGANDLGDAKEGAPQGDQKGQSAPPSGDGDESDGLLFGNYCSSGIGAFMMRNVDIFSLILLTVFFAGDIYINYKESDVPLELQNDHKQYLAGVLAIFVGAVINMSMVLLRLYKNAEYKVNVVVFLFSVGLYIFVVATSTFLHWVTESVIILSVSLFAPPILFLVVPAWLAWKYDNDFHLIPPDPEEGEALGFFQKYKVLIMEVLTIALIGAMGATIAVYSEPAYVGYSIGFTLVVLLLTAIPMLEWFNSKECSWNMIVQGVLGQLFFIGFCVLVYAEEMKGETEDKRPVAVLLVLLAYPSLVLLVSSIWEYSDNGGRLTWFVIIGFSVCSTLIFAGFIALAVLVEPYFIGATLAFVFAMFLIGKFLLPWLLNHFRRATQVVVVIVAVLVLGYTVSIAVQDNRGFLGWSMGLGVVFVVLLALSYQYYYLDDDAAGESLTYIYSPFLLPVYRDQRNNQADPLVEDNKRVFVVVLLCLTPFLWGVSAVFFITKVYVGLGVAAVSIVMLVMFILDTTNKSRHMFHESVRFLKESSDRYMTMVERVKKHCAKVHGSSVKQLKNAGPVGEQNEGQSAGAPGFYPTDVETGRGPTMEGPGQSSGGGDEKTDDAEVDDEQLTNEDGELLLTLADRRDLGLPQQIRPIDALNWQWLHNFSRRLRGAVPTLQKCGGGQQDVQFNNQVLTLPLALELVLKMDTATADVYRRSVKYQSHFQMEFVNAVRALVREEDNEIRHMLEAISLKHKALRKARAEAREARAQQAREEKGSVSAEQLAADRKEAEADAQAAKIDEEQLNLSVEAIRKMPRTHRTKRMLLERLREYRRVKARRDAESARKRKEEEEAARIRDEQFRLEEEKRLRDLGLIEEEVVEGPTPEELKAQEEKRLRDAAEQQRLLDEQRRAEEAAQAEAKRQEHQRLLEEQRKAEQERIAEQQRQQADAEEAARVRAEMERLERERQAAEAAAAAEAARIRAAQLAEEDRRRQEARLQQQREAQARAQAEAMRREREHLARIEAERQERLRLEAEARRKREAEEAARREAERVRQEKARQLQLLTQATQQAIKDNMCTFTKTGPKFCYQKWYRCMQCPQGFNEVCAVCLQTCHKGHRVVQGDPKRKFYCDCGSANGKAKGNVRHQCFGVLPPNRRPAPTVHKRKVTRHTTSDIKQGEMSTEFKEAKSEVAQAGGRGLWQDRRFPKALALKNKRAWATLDWKPASAWTPVRNSGNQTEVFVGEFEPDDIRQGAIGDCWFLSALAVLTNSEKHADKLKNSILTKTVEHKQLMRHGVYECRFIKAGQERRVVVDSFFPSRGTYPAFVHSSKPWELWPCIIEKAYAKLHKCYQAIESGFVDQALMDLTGGVGSRINMRKQEVKQQISNGTLFQILLKYHADGYLMGAGSPAGTDSEENASPSGIVQGHAYSILDIRHIRNYQLIKLRNPWGRKEWLGDFSDKSDKWTRYLKNAVEFKDAEDGTFWMPFSAFTREFEDVYLCRFLDEAPWTPYGSFDGVWDQRSAGGCTNYASVENSPQFHLHVTQPNTTVVIMFEQEETRGLGRKYFGIAIEVYSNNGHVVKKTRPGRLVVSNPESYIFRREVSVETEMQPSRFPYTVLCSTFYPNKMGNYRVSVYSQKPIRFTPVPGNGTESAKFNKGPGAP